MSIEISFAFWNDPEQVAPSGLEKKKHKNENLILILVSYKSFLKEKTRRTFFDERYTSESKFLWSPFGDSTDDIRI